jgi:hypothetical protein
MNRALVNRIAEAVLYEGYILYPYRPSVKNRQRWTFGGLYPEAYCQAQQCGDTSGNQTECLVRGGDDTTVEVAVRFLHLTARIVGVLDDPLSARSQDAEPPFRLVESLRVGDRVYHTWQEAEEREIILGELALAAILEQPQRKTFAFPGKCWQEPLTDASGQIVAVLVREQQCVAGVIEVSATSLAAGLARLSVRVTNQTRIAGPMNRDAALLRALVSTHTILGVRGGDFVSLLDPPASCREAAAACRNVGTWPVLVGEEGQTDTLLSSPIILYDYPELAPESPGNFFDATEIDEMLTLRILTMTDAEKQEMAAVDDRARELLARTESMAREQLLGLHGTVRGLRPIGGGNAHE